MPPIYYPPPQPFQGGWQPLEPGRVTPADNPPATDNPPFTRSGLIVAMALLALAWQPGPAQPQTSRPIAAVAVSSAAPADNPPFGEYTRIRQVLDWWINAPGPLPQLGWRGFTPPSVDAPPPLSRARQLATISAATYVSWQPPDQIVYTSRVVSEYVPDNPPFGQLTWIWPILREWEPSPRPRLPQLPRIVPQGQPVDNPPFAIRPWLSTVLAFWQPGPPTPQQALGKSPLPSVDPPPVIGIDPANLNLFWDVSWRPSPPAPQVGAHVPVSVSAVQVDNPPFGLTQPASAILTAWIPGPPLPTIPRYLVQPSAASVDNPPIGIRPHPWLSAVLTAWQPGPPQPQAPPIHTILSVDSPTPTSVAGQLAGILAAWQPGPPASQAGAHVPVSVSAVPVDNPPFGLSQPASPILTAWIPGPPLPTLTRYLVQPSTASVDNPPIGIRPYPWLSSILQTWQPGPPQPQVGAHVPVSVSAVPADQPPFGLETNLLAIVTSWQPGLPTPWVGRYVPQVAAAVADVPPPIKPQPVAILLSWLPADTQIQLRTLVAPLPGVSVDNPVPGSRFWLQSVLSAWQPAPWVQQSAPRLVQPAAVVPADNPPFGLKTPLEPVYRAWQPGPPQPQVGRQVPVSVSAVSVNNPPFAVRPWLSTVLQAWVPGPPKPILRVVEVTASGAPTITQLLAGPFTIMIAGAGVISSERGGAGPITREV